ncbi:MAG: hypothetical protein AB1Z57_11465 [Acidimicrobiia bacterium]
MNEQDLLIFAIGGIVVAMAFWGLIAYGVMAFQRWQAEMEARAAEERRRQQVLPLPSLAGRKAS